MDVETSVFAVMFPCEVWDSGPGSFFDFSLIILFFVHIFICILLIRHASHE